MSRADAGTAQGFSITVPVRSAREAQVVTALAELYLRYSSPDRDRDQDRNVRDVDNYPAAKALEYLAMALLDHVLPDFQLHFYEFWEPGDEQLWLGVADMCRDLADEIRTAVPGLVERRSQMIAAIPVSTASSGLSPQSGGPTAARSLPVGLHARSPHSESGVGVGADGQTLAGGDV